MKKIYSLALAAVAILSAASCQKELVNSNVVETGEKFTVVATAADTKTVLEGNVAYWMPGDKITIFDATGAPVVFTTNITEKAAKAEFTAESFNAPDSLVAVYNPTRSATLTDGKIYPLRAGGDQKPVAGSFDPNAAIAVGGSKAAGSNELVFNNIHALVKFTVGDVVPSSVKLVNNGGGIIVGLLYWNVEAAAIEHSGAGESSVTVSGTYEKGQTYYIAVTPNEAKGGLSVYFDDVLVKNTGETITLLPNTIYNLGTLPAPAEEPEVPAEVKVVLNELCGNRVECDSFASANKFIELYNAGDAEADLAGWQIIKNNEDIVWTAPEGTKLAAGAYLVLEADTIEPAVGFSAGFSAKKEVKIEIKDAAGNSVDVFCRGVDTTPMAEDPLPENKEASFSRVPNGTGAFAYAVPTPGAANGEKTGDIEGYTAPQPEEPEQPEVPVDPADPWATAATAVNGPDATDDQKVKELKAYADDEYMHVRVTTDPGALGAYGANYIDMFVTDGEGTSEVWWGWTTTGTDIYYKEHKGEIDAATGELTKMRWYLPDETRVYVDVVNEISADKVVWYLDYPLEYLEPYKSSTGKVYISFLVWMDWGPYWAIPARGTAMLEVAL